MREPQRVRQRDADGRRALAIRRQQGGDAGSELTTRILIGMLAGAAVGVLLHPTAADGALRGALVDGVFHVVGEVFLASLKLLIVPLVFVSLVCGTAALDDSRRLGRIGVKTLILYLVTTALAVLLALGAAVLVAPGEGFDLSTTLEYSSQPAPSLSQVLIEIFPTNPVRAMAEGNMLQIIVFALLFGFALMQSGPAGARVLALFRDLDSVVLRLVMLLMQIAPYGVFCLVARVFAAEGLPAIVPLAKYFALVIVVLLLHVLLVYSALLRFARLPVLGFWRRMTEPVAVAFSTASSNATLPVSLENAEYRLGVDNSIASFTLPLGATVNMDGTAILQGVATVFIAQVYGVDLAPSDYALVVLTATLASIGTAGVPGAGLVMLAMVLRQVSLPVEGIGLIIGVDRLLDMARTVVNISGDSAVSCVVARSEGKLDLSLWQAPESGEA